MLARIDLRYLYVPAILLGIAWSWTLSGELRQFFPAWRYQGLAVSLTGTIISLDPTEKIIEMTATSVFADGNAARMRVAYSDSTVWSSSTYIFDSDTVVKQERKLEAERPLPAGTLVWLLIDPDATGTYSARGITFLRRTDI